MYIKGLSENVDFLGSIVRNSVFKELAMSDLFISCSVVEVSLSVLESIACGTPALISNIPPHVEIANNLKYVKTFNLKKNDLIKNVIKLHSDKEFCLKNTNSMHKDIENKFSLKLMLNKYDELYDYIIKKNHFGDDNSDIDNMNEKYLPGEKLNAELQNNFFGYFLYRVPSFFISFLFILNLLLIFTLYRYLVHFVYL